MNRGEQISMREKLPLLSNDAEPEKRAHLKRIMQLIVAIVVLLPLNVYASALTAVRWLICSQRNRKVTETSAANENNDYLINWVMPVAAQLLCSTVILAVGWLAESQDELAVMFGICAVVFATLAIFSIPVLLLYLVIVWNDGDETLLDISLHYHFDEKHRNFSIVRRRMWHRMLAGAGCFLVGFGDYLDLSMLIGLLTGLGKSANGTLVLLFIVLEVRHLLWSLVLVYSNIR